MPVTPAIVRVPLLGYLFLQTGNHAGTGGQGQMPDGSLGSGARLLSVMRSKGSPQKWICKGNHLRVQGRKELDLASNYWVEQVLKVGLKGSGGRRGNAIVNLDKALSDNRPSLPEFMIDGVVWHPDGLMHLGL